MGTLGNVPLASAHGRCTVAALSCIQWKAHHKFRSAGSSRTGVWTRVLSSQWILKPTTITIGPQGTCLALLRWFTNRLPRRWWSSCFLCNHIHLLVQEQSSGCRGFRGQQVYSTSSDLCCCCHWVPGGLRLEKFMYIFSLKRSFELKSNM